MAEGMLLGGGAMLCVAMCAEAGSILITVGGSAVALGGAVGGYDYLASPGPKNSGGLWEAIALGMIENGPYPIEKLFSIMANDKFDGAEPG